jgi:hypothetical protein
LKSSRKEIVNKSKADSLIRFTAPDIKLSFSLNPTTTFASLTNEVASNLTHNPCKHGDGGGNKLNGEKSQKKSTAIAVLFF